MSAAIIPRVRYRGRRMSPATRRITDTTRSKRVFAKAVKPSKSITTTVAKVSSLACSDTRSTSR